MDFKNIVDLPILFFVLILVSGCEKEGLDPLPIEEEEVIFSAQGMIGQKAVDWQIGADKIMLTYASEADGIRVYGGEITGYCMGLPCGESLTILMNDSTSENYLNSQGYPKILEPGYPGFANDFLNLSDICLQYNPSVIRDVIINDSLTGGVFYCFGTMSDPVKLEYTQFHFNQSIELHITDWIFTQDYVVHNVFPVLYTSPIDSNLILVAQSLIPENFGVNGFTWSLDSSTFFGDTLIVSFEDLLNIQDFNLFSFDPVTQTTASFQITSQTQLEIFEFLLMNSYELMSYVPILTPHAQHGAYIEYRDGDGNIYTSDVLAQLEGNFEILNTERYKENGDGIPTVVCDIKISCILNHQSTGEPIPVDNLEVKFGFGYEQ